MERMAFRADIDGREDGLAPLNEKGEKVLLERLRLFRKGTPVAEAATFCRPIGLMRQLDFAWNNQWLMAGEVNLQVFLEWHEVRTVHLGKNHPKSLQPTYMGHSVGRWEGETLVVDTIGFNDRTWLDRAGTPHGMQLHLIEHLSKIEGGKVLEDVVTIEDPEFFTRPYSLRLLYSWRPDLRLEQVTCEEAMRANIVDGVIVQ